VSITPRAATLALLALIALAPPGSTTATAAALGAVLLALSGLDALSLGAADLAVAHAARQDAKPILAPAPRVSATQTAVTIAGCPSAMAPKLARQPDTHQPGAVTLTNRRHPAAATGRTALAPAPGEDILFHQPLINNALLAVGQWPSPDTARRTFTALLGTTRP
jgi:hypothetical protein